jgi:hypothetical protein
MRSLSKDWRSHFREKLIAVPVALAALAFGAPLAAAAPSTHRAAFRADPTALVDWRSPQRFTGDVQIVRVTVNGRTIYLGEEADSCSAYMYGRGVSVRFVACGRRFRLRVVIASTRRARVVVVYDAVRERQ